jgi:rsbT co-antagonist protein RsbR
MVELATRNKIVELLTEHVVELSTDVAKAAQAENIKTYTEIALQDVVNLIVPCLRVFIDDYSKGQSTNYAAYWGRIGAMRAHQHDRVEDMHYIIRLGYERMSREVEAHYGEDYETLAEWYNLGGEIIMRGSDMLTHQFMVAHREIIAQQAQHIRELTTPIIPVHDQILVLPLVGSVDTNRASQVIEELLTSINEHKAQVVIIDVTGIPIVDTHVANHLVQAARASQLLGCRVLMVGIRPEVAQTMVQLGVDLSSLSTLANLQAGLNYALKLLGLSIGSSRN